MKALCQDCLKVFTGDDAMIAKYHQEEAFCDCGGQVCGCPSCAACAIDIELYGIEETKRRHPGEFQ